MGIGKGLLVAIGVGVLIGGVWNQAAAQPTGNTFSDSRAVTAGAVVNSASPGAEALAAMTTDAVVVELMGQPLEAIHSSDRTDGGLSGFAKVHGGVRELLGRPDAGTSLLIAYKDLFSTVGAPPGDTPAEKGGYALRFMVVELLLSAPEVVRQLDTKDEQLAVLSAVLTTREAQARYDKAAKTPLFGEATLDVSALAAMKYLEALQAPEFIKWREKHPDSGVKGKRGLSSEEVNAIMAMSARYVRSASR